MFYILNKLEFNGESSPDEVSQLIYDLENKYYYYQQYLNKKLMHILRRCGIKQFGYNFFDVNPIESEISYSLQFFSNIPFPKRIFCSKFLGRYYLNDKHQ